MRNSKQLITILERKAAVELKDCQIQQDHTMEVLLKNTTNCLGTSHNGCDHRCWYINNIITYGESLGLLYTVYGGAGKLMCLCPGHEYLHMRILLNIGVLELLF